MMDVQKLAKLIEDNAIIGYEYTHKPVMTAEFANGVTIEIRLSDSKMPVGMHRPKREGAEYIAKLFFESINKKRF